MPRKGIQLAVPFEEKRLLKWEPPYIVQPKLDGERCRALPLGEGKNLLVSSEENPIFSVPHINEELNKLDIGIELDGELYCHGMSFEEIHSIVSRTVNLHEDHKEIKLNLFDLVTDQPQYSRIMHLNAINRGLLSFSKYIKVVPIYICESLSGIMSTYDSILSSGYEGIIVRHIDAPYIRKRSIYMMKFKPKREDIYEIIGFKEEIDKEGNPKDRLGAVVCRGEDGNEFSVGSGFSDEDRERIWDRRGDVLKERHKLRVQYQHLTTGKKVPRFPVAMEVIK
jgi:DNA ligase 1